MNRKQARLLLFAVLTLVFASSLQTLVQAATSPTPSTEENSSFFNTALWQNIAVAIVSVILTALAAYILNEITRRQGNGRRLSYSVFIQDGLVRIEKDIKKKIKVLYDGKEIKNLYDIRCSIENTGASVVKSEEIRFEFSQGTEILTPPLNPIPQPELRIEVMSDSSLKPHELKYKIGHLERGQSVNFNYTVTSDNSVDLKLHPFNEDGDVGFVPKAISRVDDEKEKITKFLTFALFYLLFPSVISFVNDSALASSLSALLRIFIILYWLPFIPPFCEAVSNAILASYIKDDSEKQYTISVNSIENGGYFIIDDGTKKPNISQ